MLFDYKFLRAKSNLVYVSVTWVSPPKSKDWDKSFVYRSLVWKSNLRVQEWEDWEEWNKEKEKANPRVSS